MKKICILSTVNIKHMSLIKLYTDYFDSNKIQYDIIYIDKYKEKENINAKKVYRYNLKIDREWNILKKIRKYYSFRPYAKKIIKENKYDFIIVWNSLTAILFSDFLISRFKKKYCLNIRDYFFEKNIFIYLLQKKLIVNSKFTTISSKGFEEFLPKYKYIKIHSLNLSLLDRCEKRKDLISEEKPIRITFIGYVRFFEEDKKLIDELGNDSRFILQFFGQGAEVLNEYAKNKNYNNVICSGRFPVEDTYIYLNKTDIINNLYGSGKIELDTAISIKLYYGVFLRLPIIGFKNTYTSKVLEENNLGIAIEKNYENLGDTLYDWYRNIDFEKFKCKCNEFIEEVQIENKELYTQIDKEVSYYKYNEENEIH